IVVSTQRIGCSGAVAPTPPAPTLSQLVLNPSSVTLSAGATQQFTVGALWSDGSTALPALTWSPTGGTITSGGLYTAGSTAGTFRVIASGGGKADTSTVTIPSTTSVPSVPGSPQYSVATQRSTSSDIRLTWSL